MLRTEPERIRRQDESKARGFLVNGTGMDLMPEKMALGWEQKE